MRKRTVNHVADTVFWYLLYFLPVIAYLLFMLCEPAGGTSLVNFQTFLTNIGFGIVADNTIIDVFASVFGANGLMPVFVDNSIFMFFSYFVTVYMLHLFVDLLLLLPRIVHNFSKKIGGE